MEIDENSNDSGSDGSSNAEEQELAEKAANLEKELDVNKYLYDVHLELVGLYRKLGDLTSMREAYERFHNCYPLTPKIWLDWIRDEISLASTEPDKQRIFELFEKALQDYLSVELWFEYCQYAIGASNAEATRGLIERALTAGGLHVADGSLLWDTLREYESAHLGVAPKGSEEWNQQAAKLVEVYKRQLSVPLLGMESTYEEFKSFAETLPKDFVDFKAIDWGYKKALKALETYKPFEEQLLISPEDHGEMLSIFRNYIKAVDDPSETICLYERALLPLCLVPDLWLDYSNFVLKLGQELAIKTITRALRNCPWSEELWIFKLRVLEKFGSSTDKVMEAFESGLANTPNNLQLWLSYLDYNLRQNPQITDKLFEQAVQTEVNDPTFKIIRLQARVKAQKKDMVEARKLWKGILQGDNKKTASVWLEFINLEKTYGDLNEARKQFKQALKFCSDWPQFIADEYDMFERQFGSVDDIMMATKLIKEKLAEVVAVKEEETQKPSKRKHSNEAIVHEKRIKKEEEKAPARKPIEKDPEKTVFVSNLLPGVLEDKLKEVFPNSIDIEVVRDAKGKSRCFGYVQFSMAEEAQTALARDRELVNNRPIFISRCKPDKHERQPAFKYATNLELNKLFIRGLPISHSKEDVEKLFKPFGAVDVRLVFHKSGQFKGLAYIEFKNQEEAQKALRETDQIEIDGHKITVSFSQPPPKKGPQKREEEARSKPKSRLQTSLIPRSVSVKKSDPPENGVAKKSNDDFRKMFLN